MAHPDQIDSLVAAIEDALLHGLIALPPTSDAHETAQRSLSALRSRIPDQQPEATSDKAPQVLDHLPGALQTARGFAPAVAAVAEGLAPLADELSWKPRSQVDGESTQFRSGHANTHVIGPSGLEKRSDVVVGLSLVAPEVEYPQHNHPPRELYIPLSEGEWYRESKQWYRPGPGGIVYHEENIIHAMRAKSAPLLAMWILWVG